MSGPVAVVDEVGDLLKALAGHRQDFTSLRRTANYVTEAEASSFSCAELAKVIHTLPVDETELSPTGTVRRAIKVAAVAARQQNQQADQEARFDWTGVTLEPKRRGRCDCDRTWDPANEFRCSCHPHSCFERNGFRVRRWDGTSVLLCSWCHEAEASEEAIKAFKAYYDETEKEANSRWAEQEAKALSLVAGVPF